LEDKEQKREYKNTGDSLAAGRRGGQFDRTRNFAMKSDDFVKSHQGRHPGESRGPELLVFSGFRLSPE